MAASGQTQDTFISVETNVTSEFELKGNFI